ncbi:MAG: hypothetical protein IPP46_10000 [Bacteroidetes bacterium]|nr:hypothetical protein [Bacteroidota bacterium]
MTNNYKSMKLPTKKFCGMASVDGPVTHVRVIDTKWICSNHYADRNGSAQSYFYGPVYRSSAGSTFDWSRYSYLYTATELSTAGIPSGATIVGLPGSKTLRLSFQAQFTTFYSVYEEFCYDCLTGI